jgi:CheY-like chemotaxis protein
MTMTGGSERRVLVAVLDLFFATRIAETARALGIAIEACDPIALAARMGAARPALAIVDLHATGVLEAVRAARADPACAELPVVGFYSHVDRSLAEAAREAGVTQVLARSAFTARLAAILRGE